MQYNLVFEGGGAKGAVFVGAMQAFEERDHTFKRVLGTSAGAITATLLAAGYDSSALMQATSERLADGRPRFTTFMDTPQQFTQAIIENSVNLNIFRQVNLLLIPDRIEEKIDMKVFEWLMKIPAYRQIFSFVEQGGLYAGSEFITWIQEKLDADGRNLAQATLAEFHSQTGVDLTVVASDIIGEGMLALNHRTAPDCPVAYAVRMSMSIPFVWQEITWQPKWGSYRGKDITGHAVVDGGVLSNFPIELLISRRPDIVDIMGPHDGTYTLGFLIDESLSVPDSEETAVQTPADENGKSSPFDLLQSPAIKRVKHLINTMTMARDKQVIDLYADGVCRLPAKGYGTTEFDMSDARREALIAAGRAAASAFFDKLQAKEKGAY